MSVVGSWDQVLDILDAANKYDLVYVMRNRKSLIEELIRFLKPFDHATKVLEKWKAPTLHLVANTVTTLIAHCEVRNEERVIEIELPDGSIHSETIAADSMYIKALKPKVRMLC